jgi:hypothetical protein
MAAPSVMLEFVAPLTADSVSDVSKSCADIALEHGLPAGLLVTFDPDEMLLSLTFLLDLDPERWDSDDVERLAEDIEAAVFGRTVLDRGSTDVTLGVRALPAELGG